MKHNLLPWGEPHWATHWFSIYTRAEPALNMEISDYTGPIHGNI